MHQLTYVPVIYHFKWTFFFRLQTKSNNDKTNTKKYITAVFFLSGKLKSIWEVQTVFECIAITVQKKKIPHQALKSFR